MKSTQRTRLARLESKTGGGDDAEQLRAEIKSLVRDTTLVDRLRDAAVARGRKATPDELAAIQRDIDELLRTHDARMAELDKQKYLIDKSASKSDTEQHGQKNITANETI